jgi:hypothetical protein
MALFHTMNARDRLKAWRERNHKRANDGALPPNYLHQKHQPTNGKVGKTGKSALFYGNGLGDGPNRRGVLNTLPCEFVGYADEVLGSINHTGWFADEDCEYDLRRGVVFKVRIPWRVARTDTTLPDPEGEESRTRVRYLIGVEWGERGARLGFDSGGGYILYGSKSDFFDNADDAARCADQQAEQDAEHDREERREEREEEEEQEREAAEQEARNDAERMALADMPTNGAD